MPNGACERAEAERCEAGALNGIRSGERGAEGIEATERLKKGVLLGTRADHGNLSSARQAAFAAANAVETKKAHGTLVLDVRQVTLLADYFVITGGETASQVRAIVESVSDALLKQGRSPVSVEGKADGRWVLLDYGDVIVHVLHEKERGFYKLEQFWNHALIVDRKDWSQLSNV